MKHDHQNVENVVPNEGQTSRLPLPREAPVMPSFSTVVLYPAMPSDTLVLIGHDGISGTSRLSSRSA